ncbi:MAG: aspartate/glutamate racemase, partial [Burkholderiaceae bacterium]|nr:aspartate/glutamate racemase [Burkholderiaceae bacterium]
MKTLGILGGMSWESSAVYYRLLNQAVAARRGGLHSAPLVLASVDFETIAARQREADWP